jgi:hypothetical protein
MQSKHLELVSNPLHDIRPTTIDQSSYQLFVSYMRSAEALSLNENNQDAFAVWSNDNRFVATIADGVGQSFRGDIAAMAVVQTVSQVLWEQDVTHQKIDHIISSELTRLSPKVQDLLCAIDISHHPTMFRDALELRRQLGSESVFAACAVDWHHDIIYLCWLGDCRIKLIDVTGNPIALDKSLFRTVERWSSKRVLVGDLHSIRMPLHSIRRIAMYSDGLHLLDSELLNEIDVMHLVETSITKSSTLPESDDITLVTCDVTKVK